MTTDSQDQPIIAAFDFDGTLTYRDTLLPFLLFSAGRLGAITKILPVLPTLMGYVLGRVTRQAAKEALITSFFRGIPLDELQRLGRDFAERRVNQLIKPEGMRRLQWHQQQGHRCILVSANLDVYLEPWAQSAGFETCVCSRVESNGDGSVTGRLQGLNCWGPEKVRRLDELLGVRDTYQLFAYGDSRGDREMLSSADHAFFRKMPIPQRNSAK